MKMIVLGTGHAVVTKCYNTCFALTDENDYMLVDAGGGNGILTQLEKANIPLNRIRYAFVSHSHTDHLLGMIWVIRLIGSSMALGKYEGDFSLYCHNELALDIQLLIRITMDKKVTNLIGHRIHIIPVEDGQHKTLLGYSFTFFDLNSTKTKQYGFVLNFKHDNILAFIGDEPYNPSYQKYVVNCSWLLSEAFCLHEEKDLFKPYEKHHSTVKDSCLLAEQLNVKNLILWHTEDKNIDRRKALYTTEGKRYYSGNLFVPDDLEIIEL